MQKILIKFDCKNLLIKEYNNWVLLLRKEQVTLGSLVLIEKSFKTRYSEISNESVIEFGVIVNEIEFVLKDLFFYDKINYLMLMMVDDEVHYHVIPRYSHNIIWNGVNFGDNGWPGLVNFSSVNVIDGKNKTKLKALLISKFEKHS
jgi:diadenosine tetraphosphate (Ap4A) HIT family hydrolase